MSMELSGAGETLTAIVVSEEINNSGGQGDSDAKNHVDHACANCSTILNGKYCHNCGQIGHIHRSLLHMVEETLHGIFHFDTKAWRTIPSLIFKPGVLTRNYIDGKRASYVSPLALFLFLNFFMFFVLSQVFKDSNTNFIDGKLPRETLVKKIGQLTTEIDTQLREQANSEKEGKFDLDAMLENHKNLRELREFQEQIDELDGKPATVEKYTTELQALQAELAKQKADNAKLKTTINKDDEAAYQKVLVSNQRIKFTESDIEYINKRIKNLQKLKSEKDSSESSAAAKSDAAKGDENSGKIDTKITDVPWLDQLTKHVEEHRELVEYKMKKNAASFAFLLMPISLPFLWLLFMFKRNVVMFDHAVFSLYSLSFMCLLTSTVVVMGHFNWGATAALLFIFGTPLHMYKQLRYTYQLGVFGTLWRTFALLLISLTALSIYAMLVLYLSAAPK